MIDAYPLSWPAGWPRTANQQRKAPRFQKKENVLSGAGGWTKASHEINVEDGAKRVLSELRLLGVDRRTIIISTNVELRRDGLPRIDRANVGDPGVAVYWADPETKQQDCMAIDAYDTVAGNLAAVAKTLEAMRAIERHGGAQILKRAFQGFKALPSSTTPALSTEQAARTVAWRENGHRDETTVTQAADMILSDVTWARTAVRKAVSKTHPDAGGKQADFQVVMEAKRVLEAHHGVSL